MESLSPLILLLLPYTDIAKAFNDTLFFGVCLQLITRKDFQPKINQL